MAKFNLSTLKNHLQIWIFLTWFISLLQRSALQLHSPEGSAFGLFQYQCLQCQMSGAGHWEFYLLSEAFSKLHFRK